ncbi:hypothetical protein [Sorangium sp. So ce362]|uniref:hypothetical protein n=1 Tax=Sorangium sp. So ce362 TaxID=3133303 RepID=UPI003F63A87C
MLEAWLAANHAREAALWLKIYKEGSGAPTATRAQALDVAIRNASPRREAASGPRAESGGGAAGQRDDVHRGVVSGIAPLKRRVSGIRRCSVRNVDICCDLVIGP